MRPSRAIPVLVILISGCSAGADAAVSAPSAASTSAVTSASPSPSASAGPDWSALPDLGANIIASTALIAEWPTRFASVTDDGIWLPNMNVGGPPAVARLDTDTMEQTAVIELGGEAGAFPPDAQATAPSAEGIWVALAYQRAVALIDPVTNTVVRRIEVDGAPYSLAVDGESLWIADFENSAVLRIDTATGEELLRTSVVSGPLEIAIGFDSVWVADHDTPYVFRLDPMTGEVAAMIWVGGYPFVTIGFGSVWAGSQNDLQVSRIDPATNEVVATIPMPEHTQDLAVAGDSVWAVAGPQRGACERNSYLVRVDPASDEADGIMDLPCAFGIVSDGRTLWAAKAKFEGDLGSILSIDPGQRP